jgi:hypothetical protein
MKNELDRNESEMEYYEDIVEKLASRCEDLSTEKKNLQIELDACLSERNGLFEENLRIQQELSELNRQHIDSIATFQQTLSEQQSQFQLQTDSLNNQLYLNLQVRFKES